MLKKNKINVFLIENTHYFHIQLMYSLSLVLIQIEGKLRITNVQNK